MSNNTSHDDDDPKLPRVKKKGIPLWVFKLIRILLTLCPCDAYVASPLLILIIIAVLGVLTNFFQKEWQETILFLLIGLLAVTCMAVRSSSNSVYENVHAATHIHTYSYILILLLLADLAPLVS